MTQTNGNRFVLARRSRWLRITLAASVVAAALPHPASADSPAPAWEALPDDQTLVAVRIANGQAFIDGLKQQTKLGAVLFSDQRIEQFKQLLKEQTDGNWEQIDEKLTKYGLSIDELPQYLSGESGFALLYNAGDEGEWQLAGLTWMEPGPDLAVRTIEAVEKAVADYADGPTPVTRLDTQIEGHDVMRLTLPRIEYEYQEHAAQWQVESDETTDSQLPSQAAAPIKHTRYTPALLARVGGRLLYAWSFAPSDSPTDPAEELTGLFARFLAAQQGDGGGFVARIADSDGVAEGLPQGGITAVEVFADLAPLVQLGGDSFKRVMGADRLGAAAVRMTLNGNNFYTGTFIAAPAPREGVLALLDQEELAAQPLAWVPGGVVGYQHFSVDLGDAYSQIKQVILQEFGAVAEQGFMDVEQRCQVTLQTGVAALLSSLGQQHTFLIFEPHLNQMESEEGPIPFTDRMAIVWQVQNDAPWKLALQQIGNFAAMSEGLQFAEEQGFTGWRLQYEPLEGGLMLGQGYLVFAYGQGALERTLSALTNPPAESDSLRGSAIVQRVGQLLSPEPGIMYQVLDGDRYARSMRKLFEMMLNKNMWTGTLVAAGEDGPNAAEVAQASQLLEALRELMPDDDEIEGMLGPAGGYVGVNQKGLLQKTVNHLPAEKR